MPTGFEQVRIDDKGTFGAFNPTTSEAIAFPDQASFGSYFPGQTPNASAPLASFDTSGVTGANANKLVSVFTSTPARTAVGNAAATLSQNPTTPAFTAGTQELDTLIGNLTSSGASLSPDQQSLLSQLNKIKSQITGTTVNGQTALGTNDGRGAVSAADTIDELAKQRSTMLNQLLTGLSDRQGDIQTIQGMFGETPYEQELSKTVNEKTSQLRNYDVNTMKGEFAIEDQSIPSVIAGRQQLQLSRQRTFERLGLSNELMALTDLLKSQTASRSEKLEAAKFMFDAKSQTLSDSLAIYKELAPQNVATHIDDETGKMTVIMRNPMTGENYKQDLGQVGTPKAWTNNQDFAQASGVYKPFFQKEGDPTVINSQTGKAYSTWEQFLADGGKPELIQTVSPTPFSKDSILGSAAEGYYQITPQGLVRLTAPADTIDTSWTFEPLSPAEAQKLGVPFGTTKGEAANMGITPTAPLSTEAIKLQGNVESGLRALKTVKDELFGAGSADKPIDQLSNVKSNILLRESVGAARNYVAAKKEMLDIITRLRTGAAISLQEEEFYKAQLPLFLDNEQTVKTKLKRFEELFTSMVPSRLKTMTAPESDSLFEEFENGGADKTTLKAP